MSGQMLCKLMCMHLNGASFVGARGQYVSVLLLLGGYLNVMYYGGDPEWYLPLVALSADECSS
jgi:hypothetical protein